MQKIKTGDRLLPKYNLRVKQAPLKDAILKAIFTITFTGGRNQEMVKKIIQNLPATLDCPIYKHQGQLLTKLRKLGVDAA